MRKAAPQVDQTEVRPMIDRCIPAELWEPPVLLCNFYVYHYKKFTPMAYLPYEDRWVKQLVKESY